MNPRHSRIATRAAGCGILLLTAACATYQSSPLPPVDELTAAPAVDRVQLEIAAAELQHPILAPLDLDLDDGLSPEEAAVLAVLANPDLRVARDARGIAAAQLIAAGLLPNPVLNGALDHPHGAGSEETVSAYLAGLSLDIEPLVVRGARREEARARVESVDLGIAWQEWLTAQAAYLDTVRITRGERRLRLIAEEIETEAETADVLAAATVSGDASIQDLGGLLSSLERLRRIRGEMDRELSRTRIELNHRLGLSPGTHLVMSSLEPAVTEVWGPLPDETRLMETALESRLDLEALRRGYDAEEARVRRAVLSQFPGLSIGVAASRDEANLHFLGGFVTLDLPIFDRAQAEIALEEATRTRLRHEYEARIAAIRTEIAAAVEADRLLGAQLVRVQDGLKAMAEVERAESAGILTGDVDRLTYQVVRSTLVDLKLQFLSLGQARSETRVALQTAIGLSAGSAITGNGMHGEGDEDGS